MDDEYGMSIFFLALSTSLFFISVISFIFGDLSMTATLLIVMFIVSCLLGLLLARRDASIRYWCVVIVTADNGVYYAGRNLSWAEAKKLRDDLLERLKSKDLTLSVKCTNSDGCYGVRDFFKSKIIHIGWLED